MNVDPQKMNIYKLIKLSSGGMGGCISGNYILKGKHKQIVVLLGSNSSSSINKKLLQEIISASVFSQKKLKITVPKLSQVPFFNSDLIKQHKIPHSVQQLLKSVSKATALIFITPQYNGALSATILNAYQWITQVPRAIGQSTNALFHKQIAIMSCSYISQNQIQDIKLMTKTSNVKLFKEPFHVDLKQDQVDWEKKDLSERLKKKLHLWLERLANTL